MSDIAANIKTLRKEKKLSQEQFAQMLHVTRQTVSAWERGLSRPGLETIQQIAQALEAEPEQVLYGPEAGKQPVKYRKVSFWPMLWAVLFWFPCINILGWLAGLLLGGGDELIVVAGQLYLILLVMFCYCDLKDEIRNRDYYNQMPREDEEREKSEE